MKRVKKIITTVVLAISLIITPVSSPLLNYQKVEAATVKLNNTKLSVYVGKTYTLKLSGTTSKVNWTSSNSKVATVTSGGKVKGIKEGTATITAKAGTKSYKCAITVKLKKLTAEQVYNKCSSATIQINTDLGLGSGFFIAPGKVVTNYHVIEGATSIKVQFEGGKQYDVEYVLGYNKDLDIAILSVPVKNDVLTISKHGVKAGETVYAIGSSLGLTDTFTDGIVTNVKRVKDNVNYIQTNAAINHGNSGGPLLNAYGEVVGINTLISEYGQNVNLSINIDELKHISTDKSVTIKEFYNSSLKELIADDSYYTTEDTSVSGAIGTSQTITEDDEVIGSIKQGDTDYYKFTITGDNALFLLGKSLSFYGIDITNLSYTVLDLSGNQVAKSKLEYNDYYEIYVQTIDQKLSPGTYYIAVQADKAVEEFYYYLSFFFYDPNSYN